MKKEKKITKKESVVTVEKPKKTTKKKESVMDVLNEVVKETPPKEKTKEIPSKEKLKEKPTKTPKKKKTENVEKVEKSEKSDIIEYPNIWKEMDKIDKKIIKLTDSLKELVKNGVDLMSKSLKTEKEDSIKEDLEDYLLWLEQLNRDVKKFYKFGKV